MIYKHIDSLFTILSKTSSRDRPGVYIFFPVPLKMYCIFLVVLHVYIRNLNLNFSHDVLLKTIF